MRSLRRVAARLLAGTAVVVLTLLARAPALACTCAEATVEAAREGAAAVFEGRVMAIADVKSDAGMAFDKRKVTLRVVRSWKGLERDERVSVQTFKQGSLCGFPFSKNASYLVYAEEHDGELHVSLCSRTRAIAKAKEDLRVLGSGATPVALLEDAGPPQADAGAKRSAEAGMDGGSAQRTTPADGGARPPGTPDAGTGAEDQRSSREPPKQRGGGCASTRGQASLGPWPLLLPALLWRRRHHR